MVSLLPTHPTLLKLNTPATVFPAVVNPAMTMLLPPDIVAEPLLKVPLNRSALLPFQTLTVPLAMLKQPAPHEVVPRFSAIVTVPAPTAPPLTDNSLKDTDKVPPLVTPPVTVAGFKGPAKPTKSMLPARAAVGSAKANNANKITRLIECSSEIRDHLFVGSITGFLRLSPAPSLYFRRIHL